MAVDCLDRVLDQLAPADEGGAACPAVVVKGGVLAGGPAEQRDLQMGRLVEHPVAAALEVEADRVPPEPGRPADVGDDLLELLEAVGDDRAQPLVEPTAEFVRRSEVCVAIVVLLLVGFSIWDGDPLRDSSPEARIL